MFFNTYPYTDFHELNLDFLLKNYKMLLDTLKTIDEWIDTHEREYQELKQLIDDFDNGKFTPAFLTTLYNWLRVNVPDIISAAITIIDVYVTDSGYVAISYPDSWKDVKFLFTGISINIQDEEYGHLVISY